MPFFLLICCLLPVLSGANSIESDLPDKSSGAEIETVYTYTASSVSLLREDDTRIPQVRRVRISGNQTYPNMVIRQIIGTRAPGFFQRLQFWNRDGFEYSEQEARRDVIRIERFYNRRGFYNADVRFEVEDGRRDHHRKITFYINEGEPVILENMEYRIITDDPEILEEIENNRDFERSQSRSPLRPGRRYELIKHSDVEALFLNTLRNMGYAFTKVEVSADVDHENLTADLFVEITPGPLSFFSHIIIEGEQTVPKSLVLRQSGLREGDQFSMRKMRDAQQLIFRHPLFRFVTVSMPEQEISEDVDVRVRVREFPLRTIQVRGGVGTEEIIRGQVSWMHRNPFGNGHRFSTTVRASFIQQRANMEYQIPAAFNPRSNLSFSPFVLREDERNYLLYRGGINNNLTYYHSQYLIGNIGYEFSRNRIIQKDGATVQRDSTRVFNVSSLQLSALYNESTGDVGRGWAFRPFVELSGFLNTGSITYQKVSLDVRRFIDLSSITQLALRTDAGLLFSSSPFDTPANIRFYAGGTNSVRGWSRSQLGPKRVVMDDAGNFREFVATGGRSKFMFNAELRQDMPFLINGLQIAAFLDGGQVWLDYDDLNFSDLQYGVGGGIRYMSPVGPIRLDIGYKINPTDADMNRFNGVDHGGANRWALHFSIGQAF